METRQTDKALKGFAFQSHYAEVEGVRLHYFDEGQGPPVLLLHGQPMWGYLYHKMIPPLASLLVRRLDMFRKMFFRVGFHRPVAPEVMDLYKLPHPTPDTRAGMAAFPKMLPTNERHPNAEYISAIDRTLQEWPIPVLVAFSDHDPGLTLEDGLSLAERLPQARFVPIRDAGHWLQEDAGEEVADHIIDFLNEAVGVPGAVASIREAIQAQHRPILEELRQQ